MKIAVVGAGGVGGYFGARLAQAGHDVHFLCRAGAHLDAIRADGLRVEGSRGSFVAAVDATDSAAAIGPVDVVLFCVKCPDTVSAVAGASSLTHRETLWLTLQNGVDSAERLSAFVAPEQVAAGAAFVSAVISAPGVVRTTSEMSSLVFGTTHRAAEDRCHAFATLCNASGFSAEVSTDIRKTLWRKFVALATNAALTGVVRQPAGIVYRDPSLRRLARRSIEEVIAVAAASGVPLDPGQADSAMALLESFPPTMYASLYHDLVAGKPIEIAYLSGHVVALGKMHGVPTPVHDFVTAALGPYEHGAPTLR